MKCSFKEIILAHHFNVAFWIGSSKNVEEFLMGSNSFLWIGS